MMKYRQRNTGPMEQKARSRRRRENVTQILLSGIAGVGLLALTASLPNAVQLLKFFPDMDRRKSYTIRTTFSRLRKKGYIRFESKGGVKYAALTEEGRRQLRLYHQYGAVAGKVWTRWDGEWRMVVYDIPEKRRKTRQALVSVLRRHDFYKLQSSVWVYPYDCEELIQLIKADIGEGKGVVYGIVSALENDKKVREYYKLPLDR